MGARKISFSPLQRPNRREQERERREHFAGLRLTDADTRALAKALGVRFDDPRVQSARALIDRGAAYVAGRDYSFESERPSLSDLRAQTDRLRRAAKDFLLATMRLDDGTEDAIYHIMGAPRFPPARAGYLPCIFDWCPWLRQVYELQDAAHALHERTYDLRDLRDLLDEIGLKLHSRGRFCDPQEFKLAIVAVRAFEKFAEKGRGVGARRAKVVGIVARRVMGLSVGRSEFGALARRAVTHTRRLQRE